MTTREDIPTTDSKRPYRMGDDVRGERYVVEPGTLCGCCGLDGSECRCSWACALADSCTATAAKDAR